MGRDWDIDLVFLFVYITMSNWFTGTWGGFHSLSLSTEEVAFVLLWLAA